MKKEALFIGIDIAKADFYACILARQIDGKQTVKATKKFDNTEAGYLCFLSWVAQRQKDAESVLYVMEATGTYYENLAGYLHESGCTIAVELANKIKNFKKSYNKKTKTDKECAEMIARYGAERSGLRQWEPFSKEYSTLRDICREILSMKTSSNRAKNQLHAMRHSYRKNEKVVKMKTDQIEFYDSNICLLESEMRNLVVSDKDLSMRIKKIETIKGIGFFTAVSLIAETNGFKLFTSMKQLASYAGLDVVANESGTFKGKTRVSKKGNKYIRQILYMPAVAACVWNPGIKSLYERIIEKNEKLKRKGTVAAMRKLLLLTYTIWKNGTEYKADHQWQAS